MSQHTVITDGYGTFGSASFVITEGYSSSAEVVTPYPLTIVLSLSQEYGITMSKAHEYSINMSHTGGGA
jgi:hypothetical protein